MAWEFTFKRQAMDKNELFKTVGIAAVQLSKSLGLTIFATAGTEEGLSLVKENGANFVFNHSEADYTDKIMASTSNKGIDVIIEMLSNVNLANDMKMVAERGRIAIVGSRGNIEINPRLLMLRESSIKGVALGKATSEEMKEMGNIIGKGLQDGVLKPIVQKSYSLNQASQAHIEIIQGLSKKGKLIFDILN